MKPWKQRLYDGYVSTGQAGPSATPASLATGGAAQYVFHVIDRHLPADKEIAIADLACGHGRLIHCLKRRGYSRVQGVDVSPEQVRLAHACGVTEVEHGEVQDFLARHTAAFDVLFLMDVLEHLEPGELLELLDRVHDALKPGGMAVIHVPNAEGLFGMRIRYGDLTHETAFTPQSIAQALAACGLAGVACFEDTPVVHGLRSALRALLWKVLTSPARLLMLAETGARGHILSQNMLVLARRPHAAGQRVPTQGALAQARKTVS